MASPWGASGDPSVLLGRTTGASVTVRRQAWRLSEKVRCTFFALDCDALWLRCNALLLLLRRRLLLLCARTGSSITSCRGSDRLRGAGMNGHAFFGTDGRACVFWDGGLGRVHRRIFRPWPTHTDTGTLSRFLSHAFFWIPSYVGTQLTHRPPQREQRQPPPSIAAIFVLDSRQGLGYAACVLPCTAQAEHRAHHEKRLRHRHGNGLCQAIRAEPPVCFTFFDTIFSLSSMGPDCVITMMHACCRGETCRCCLPEPTAQSHPSPPPPGSANKHPWPSRGGR